MAKLATDIVVSIGGEAITLRPSLRFAIRLERRPGSFSKLASEVMDGSLSAAVEIIRDHDDSPFLESHVLDELDTLQTPLLQYVMALAGIDPEDAPANDNNAKGKSVPFAEHLAGLYRIGTGWLGWTPDTTLDATPAEISEAYRGRLELLKTVFGGGGEEAAKSDLPLDDKVKSAFASFNTVKVKRKKVG